MRLIQMGPGAGLTTALCLLLLVGLPAIQAGADEPAPAKVDEDLVETLIVQLGSRAYRAREKAQRQLIGLGYPALALLRKAHETAVDQETKFRLEKIIGAIARPRWTTDLAGAMRQAKTSGKLVMVFSTIGTLKGFA